MSLYGDYIKERLNKHILETDRGFATYVFTDEKTVYIDDIYVCPEFRKSHEASILANKIISIAKDRGCNKLLGRVVPSTKNSTDSLKVLLAYDMKLAGSTSDFILFSKEI